MLLTDTLRLELLGKWHDLVRDNIVTNLPQDEVHVRRLMQWPEKPDPAAPPPRVASRPVGNGAPAVLRSVGGVGR